jgi:hypothetical protein
VAVKVTLVPEHIVDEGLAAILTLAATFGFTVTLRVLATLDPQVLLAVTLTVPDVLPIVTIIELVLVPEVIVAPAGSDHVYPVAPATAATL